MAEISHLRESVAVESSFRKGLVYRLSPSVFAREEPVMKQAIHYEFDVVAPAEPLGIYLHLQPEEVELAIATGGTSLIEKTMRALVVELTMCVDLTPGSKG